MKTKKNKNEKIVPYIEYESILAGIKNIEERNAIFNSLDPQSQRLEMAWDGLQLVVSQSIKAPGVGRHFWNPGLEEKADKLDTPKELQTLLTKNLPASCTVCARGCVMLSRIRLGNTVNPRDYDKHMGCEDNIIGFSMDDMEDMESEFERSQFDLPYNSGSTKKLANILCNVLINGNFNIEDKTNYLIPYIQ